MEAGFGEVTIIGAGLLGASLGLALKQRGLADAVRGVGRRQSSLDVALESGAIDAATTLLEKGVKDADLIVVATPVVQASAILEDIRAHAKAGAVITDVGSTKADICGHAAKVWDAPRPFVGSHPMAGSEKFGPEHAVADLYEGSVCLVESGEGLDARAMATVRRLWESVGARVVDVEPALHDALLARTSHVPHVVAALIARTADLPEIIPELTGNGFRDTTRVAAGRPELWREICVSNQRAVLEALAEVRERMDAFTAALESEDVDALDRVFTEGRDARNRLCP